MQGNYPQHLAVLAYELRTGSSLSEAQTQLRTELADLLGALRAKHAHAFINDAGTEGLKAPHAILFLESKTPLSTKTISERTGLDALELLAWGAFEPTGFLPRAGEVHAPQGILVGCTECPDKEEIAEFHAWYDRTHAADVLRSPFYWSAERYQRGEGTLPEFLAIYETTEREPSAFEQYLAWPERDKTMSDACSVRHVWTFNHLHSSAKSEAS